MRLFVGHDGGMLRLLRCQCEYFCTRIASTFVLVKQGVSLLAAMRVLGVLAVWVKAVMSGLVSGLVRGCMYVSMYVYVCMYVCVYVCLYI